MRDRPSQDQTRELASQFEPDRVEITIGVLTAGQDDPAEELHTLVQARHVDVVVPASARGPAACAWSGPGPSGRRVSGQLFTTPGQMPDVLVLAGLHNAGKTG